MRDVVWKAMGDWFLPLPLPVGDWSSQCISGLAVRSGALPVESRVRGERKRLLLSLL